MRRVSVPITVPEEAVAGARSTSQAPPCTMVIFGATGDLSRRKLLPALFHLLRDGLLADRFQVVGVGRDPMSDDAFRELAIEAVRKSPESAGAEAEACRRFAERLGYVNGDLADRSTHAAIGARLAGFEQSDDGQEPGGRLFYLALPPSVYPVVVERLSDSGLAPRRDDPAQRPWARLIVEKPFGDSLESARRLNRLTCARFAEHQIYRIDHYLGKETVQNLLVFRFANSIFEPIWNRDHIHHVQITAAERLGVERRARYYEEAGVVRDMFQNHLLQLLTLTAMEPPATFDSEAVRAEKRKVLDAIRPFGPGELERYAVRGQYGAGAIAGAEVAGYRDEPNVAADSPVPTFAAVRFLIDNWRWKGVPFFVRSGKRMPRAVTEIAIQFRRPPHLMFRLPPDRSLASNQLIFRIQPDEGISLGLEVKVPGIDLDMATASMDLSYAGSFGDPGHSAYETLLVDAMLGDATLFTRSDSVEAAWRVVDPIIDAWSRSTPKDFPNYPAGEWGPSAADAMIAEDGAAWRRP